jgi:hypothetical protein
VAYRFKLIHNLLAAQLSGDHIIVATAAASCIPPPGWADFADVSGRGVYVSPISPRRPLPGRGIDALESLGKLDISDLAPFGILPFIRFSPPA